MGGVSYARAESLGSVGALIGDMGKNPVLGFGGSGGGFTFTLLYKCIKKVAQKLRRFSDLGDVTMGPQSNYS